MDELLAFGPNFFIAELLCLRAGLDFSWAELVVSGLNFWWASGLAEQVAFPAGGLMVTRQIEHSVKRGWLGDVGDWPSSVNCPVRPTETIVPDCLRLRICFAYSAVYGDSLERFSDLVCLGADTRIMQFSTEFAVEMTREKVAEVIRQYEAELLFPQRLQLRAFSNMPIFSEVFSEMVVKLIDRAATLLSTHVGVALPASC